VTQSCSSLAGALVTRRYAIETKGINLEQIAEETHPRLPDVRTA